MSRLQSALQRLVADLGKYEKKVALIGGLAVSARAEPRLTRDVDLAVAVQGDEDAERLVRALVGEGYAVASLVEQKSARRLATARMTFPGESERGVVGDLLFASSGIEPEVVEAAQLIEIFPGIQVPVARVGHLVVLKLLSRDDRRRPQDASDLNALRKVATDEDLTLAREAAKRIEERGYARAMLRPPTAPGTRSRAPASPTRSRPRRERRSH